MFQVAIYGKGGIGKSTMAANLSVALAERGCKVMQVGCDPKHDSTRLLLGGESQRTVLEYVRDVPPMERKLSDILVPGSKGIMCVEAGGPEPGIGCAGRGILTTFDVLKKLGCDRIECDYRIFDVLGDVVCGGFAVPLRSEYADGVVLVTSGEFMSLYAANNIMRGMRNFDTGSPRLIGIILNSRGVEGEEETVRRFADATGTEIIGIIPRDKSFAEAEGAGMTVRERCPGSPISQTIDSIVQRIADAGEGKIPMVYPRPLDDAQLSDLAAGREIRPASAEEIPRVSCGACMEPRRSIKGTKTLSSCAAYGALAAYAQLRDFAIVLHGPRSCAYLMETTRAKAVMELFERRIYNSLPHLNTYSTMMDDSASIFGGAPNLEKAIEEAISDGFTRIAVITTCMPGITGDDCIGAIDRAMKAHSGVDIQYVPADGDMTGDYNAGFMTSLMNMVRMIDPSVKPEKDYVNLIGSSFYNFQSPERKAELDNMLRRFGLKENCRFQDEGCSGDIVNYCRAEFDLVVSDTPSTKGIVAMLERTTGRKPFPVPIPVGRHDYVSWVRAVGEATGRREQAEEEIASVEHIFGEFVKEHAPRFMGRKFVIFNKMSGNADWLLEVLLELGAEVPLVAFPAAPRMMKVKYTSRYEDMISRDYPMEKLFGDVSAIKPDMMICDTTVPFRGDFIVAKFSRVGVGVRGLCEFVEYLENLMRLPEQEGWKVKL